MLRVTWCVSDWTHMNPDSNCVTRLLICSSATTFFLPSSKEQRQTSSSIGHVCLMNNNNIYCLLKDRIHGAQGENRETGPEWWWRTMQEGGCQVLWSGIVLPTPTARSPFLPAMYCSLHLSHHEPRLVERSQSEQWNNESMHCRERCLFSP